MNITRDVVEAAVKRKGYAWFDSKKDLDLNIVGIRNSTTGKTVTNKFDDWLTVSYRYEGKPVFHLFQITTDPGVYYTRNQLLSPLGVARLVPGQYRGAMRIGMHQGKYQALVQNKPVKVYRDKNLDGVYDEKAVEEGMFGINIHRSSPTATSILVDKWSAGCQVFASIRDFTKFMAIVRDSAKIFPNAFTYTLIESKDL